MSDKKFRFWAETEKRMVCDKPHMSRRSFLITPSGAVFYPDGSGKHRKGDLLLYTGLKDENGKEIYEGDIVKTEAENGYIAIIEWYPLTSGFALMEVKKQEWADDRWIYFLRNDREDLETLEVIGNIYENPELLKEDK